MSFPELNGGDVSDAGDVPTVAIVAMSNSIHTARWVSMLRHRPIRIVLVPVFECPPVDELRPWRAVRSAADVDALEPGEIGLFDLNSVDWRVAAAVDAAAGFHREAHPAFDGPLSEIKMATAHHVAIAIRKIRPDLVHSMEVQLAGYLVLEAQRRIGRAFPPWLLSNWGSDVMLFRKLARHRPVIERIFARIDGYLSECERDVGIARQFGYDRLIFPPMPASGGLIADDLPPPEAFVAPSRRGTILVKGYHGWSGRGMHILSAIRLAASDLRGFRIRLIFGSPPVRSMVERLAQETGLDIATEAFVPTHAEAVARLAGARVVVGMGISDGISTTLLEAMSVGTFPVQSSSACAGEWIQHGVGGFIVSPHDICDLSDAIAKAARDDRLVDDAATINMDVVRRRWDPELNGRRALHYYRQMIAEGAGLGCRL